MLYYLVCTLYEKIGLSFKELIKLVCKLLFSFKLKLYAVSLLQRSICT